VSCSQLKLIPRNDGSVVGRFKYPQEKITVRWHENPIRRYVKRC